MPTLAFGSTSERGIPKICRLGPIPCANDYENHFSVGVFRPALSATDLDATAVEFNLNPDGLLDPNQL